MHFGIGSQDADSESAVSEDILDDEERSVDTEDEENDGMQDSAENRRSQREQMRENPLKDSEYCILTAQKMNQARRFWTSRESSAFTTLSINQLLCLLQENDANLPASYKKKEELVQILKVSLT